MNILDYLPAGSKKAPSGFHHFNCPCCIHRGQARPDRKGRGGVIVDPDGSFSYNCFNCNTKARYDVGKPVSDIMRQILGWLGVSTEIIGQLTIGTLKARQNGLQSFIKKQTVFTPKFKTHKMPGRLITENDKKFINYLKGRGLTLADYNFHITPGEKWRNKNRIIIPYKYENKIVGWTSRYLDKRNPKFLNEHQQDGFIFGMDMQNRFWNKVIVCEGIFDAISIKCLAVMHNEISDHQLELIKQMKKEVIVVPDQDKAGLKLAEQAMENGFSLSIPEWGENIHDINEAIIKYGKAGTLLSILQCAESNKIKNTLALNKLRNRI